MIRARLAACLLPLVLSCGKVPVYDVEAGFVISDASWFEQEDTLFIFYEVRAEQGLGEPSVVEIRYTTDEVRVPWTPIEEFETVHTHVEADCGPLSLCGSTSLAVTSEPRDVEIRLRYHRRGDLALKPTTNFNVVEGSEAYANRSLIIYGVFDEENVFVQWRSRNQFPTLRNMRATELGLRREFWVNEQRIGYRQKDSPSNPYGYAVECESDLFVPLDLSEVRTTDRAAFNAEPLPVEGGPRGVVCAQATVTDAKGTFTTGAIARKNPEVRPAFPVLRSPTREVTRLNFFLGPCLSVIDRDHEEMQRQRLLLGDLPTYCTDGWESSNFVDDLIVDLRNAIEDERPQGNDMVLAIALHSEEPRIANLVEEALARVVPDERHRGSPRLAGAFVFDSFARSIDRPEVSQTTLWCPSEVELGLDGLPTIGDLPDSSIACAVLPENVGIELGPLSFSALPILAPRDQYLEFIEDFNKATSGFVQSISIRAPEYATTTDHADLGDFGSVTFLNDEFVDAQRSDAFSLCLDDSPLLVMYRSQITQLPIFAQACRELKLGREVCQAADAGFLPLDLLPTWHAALGESTYELGIFWEFPFLMQLEYEQAAAGAVSAFGVSVPFGFPTDAEAFYGSETWSDEEFDLSLKLKQCTRFCNHPTFDSAGVYHVTDRFDPTYLERCYLPHHPQFDDGGFPFDP